MGRETLCICVWAGTAVEVKALLETREMILRGGLRKRIPLAEIQQVKTEPGRLCFTVSGEKVQLHLGAVAENWADAITSAPPSLARKLGILNTTIVRMIGEPFDEALSEALAEASGIASKGASLIVACLDSVESLHSALRSAEPQLHRQVPICIVYPKGPGHAINEDAVRSLLRDNGMIDTKVASVSAKYTALRFIYRKPA